jgi:hypothetical protein
LTDPRRAGLAAPSLQVKDVIGFEAFGELADESVEKKLVGDVFERFPFCTFLFFQEVFHEPVDIVLSLYVGWNEAASFEDLDAGPKTHTCPNLRERAQTFARPGEHQAPSV